MDDAQEVQAVAASPNARRAAGFAEDQPTAGIAGAVRTIHVSKAPADTHLETLRHYDTLLVMSVEPGFGGQQFLPGVLDKVRAARRHVDTGHLTLLIEIDGGINDDTIEQAAEAGVDCFVAGSAVYGAAEPARAVQALRDRVRTAAPHRNWT